MKVAIVNQPLDGILPPDQNSIGIWTHEVARRIADRADVTVHGKWWGSMRDAGIGREVERDGVGYRFVPTAPSGAWERVASLAARRARPDWPIYAWRTYYAEYATQVAWALRRERPDVIHLHNFIGFVPLLRRACPSSALVLHMSCEWLSQLDEARIDARLHQVDAVLGTSDHITDLVRSRFEHHAGKCRTVYNGVDPSDFEGVARRRTAGADVGDEAATGPGASLLFVGRVSPEKGLHDLVDAMGTVLDRHPDAALDVVGAIGALPEDYIVGVSDDPLVRGLARFYADGADDYLAELRSRIPADRRDRITFHGPVAYEEVIERYAAADLLVNPSYSESFGMTPVEAMACEVPVVATRVGGMKETIVDGETGILVEPADPAALGEAISSILDDPRRRREMGEAGRRRVVDTFSWSSVADSLIERYEELC